MHGLLLACGHNAIGKVGVHLRDSFERPQSGNQLDRSMDWIGSEAAPCRSISTTASAAPALFTKDSTGDEAVLVSAKLSRAINSR